MIFFLRACGATCAAVLAGLVLVPRVQAADGPARRLTLQQALEEAFAGSPRVRAGQAQVEQAEGRLLAAKTYLFNPELALEAHQRSNGDSTTDRGIRLGQEIEIGGQRRWRAAEAASGLDVARAGLRREERLLAARVQAVFVEALRLRELREVERANAELARSLAEVARKRLDSGAAAQMEVNLAQVQVGRAERDLTLADGAYDVARSALAEIVGLDPVQPPELDGNLDLPPRRLPPLPELLAAAEERRADLQAFRSATAAARARIELSRREAIPNLEVEGFYAREDGTNRLLGGGVKVRIPVFNRNQGRIAEALGAHREALASTAAAQLRIRQEVAASLARYHASHAASLNLERQVLGTLEENLHLLQRSFEAGKTSWTEVLVFRREFVDAQRDYIDTVTDARLAGIEFDLACGVSATINEQESQP